jgi:hypothetical protein
MSSRTAIGLALLFSLCAGCPSATRIGADTGTAAMDAGTSGVDSGGTGVDTGTTGDAAAATDTGARADTGSTGVDSGTDSGVVSSGDADVDAWCALPPCAAPPPGCMWVGGSRCECGTLVCAGVDCSPSCTRGDYCDHCGSVPMCKPMPAAGGGICPDLYDPQCGCDGVTYSNACALADAMMPLWYPGECGGIGIDPPPLPPR